MWFAVSPCRSGRLWSSRRRCGKSSSSGSFTFRLVFRFPDEPLSSSFFGVCSWSLIVVCAVVTGSNLDEFQVTVLRFSKAAIGGVSRVCGLSSWALSFTGVSFRHSSSSRRHGQPLSCLWWCCLANTCFAGHRALLDQLRQLSRTRFVWFVSVRSLRLLSVLVCGGGVAV